MRSSNATPKSIDEYLARLTGDKRAVLESLRRTINRAAPAAEECISYQLPAFRLDGKVLLWFGAAAKHCAFYPGAAPIAEHAAELSDYATSKGTIRFAPSEPLPSALVRKLVKSRIRERSAKPTAKGRSTAKRKKGRSRNAGKA
jgi:uncharacterized protein YdhG (YjbR/CyaY superfamily)